VGWLLVGGIVAILFGIVLIVSPTAGALALLWLIGAFALVFGVVLRRVGVPAAACREGRQHDVSSTRVRAGSREARAPARLRRT
jgi:hypothetical protein